MPNDTDNIAESLACFIDIAHQALAALGHATMLTIDSLPDTKKGKKTKHYLQKYEHRCLPLSTNYLSTVGSTGGRIEPSAFSQFLSLNLVFFDAIATPKHPDRAAVVAAVQQFTALITYTYSDTAIAPSYVQNGTVEMWHCTYGWLATIESGEFPELASEGEVLRSLYDEDMRTYIVGCEASDLSSINISDIARYWGNDKKHESVFESMFNLACCFDITFNDGTTYKSSFAQLADIIRTGTDKPDHKALLDTITTHETLLASAFKIRLLLMQCGMFRSTSNLQNLQSLLYKDLSICQQETEGLTLFASISIPMQLGIVRDIIELAKQALEGSNELSLAHIIQITDMLRCVFNRYAIAQLSPVDRTQNALDCINLINNLQLVVTKLPSIAKAKRLSRDSELNRLRAAFSDASVRYDAADDSVYFIPICTAYAAFAKTQAMDWVQWTALHPKTHGLCTKLIAHLIDVKPLIAYLDRAINHPKALASERNQEFRTLSTTAIALESELKSTYPEPVDIDCEADVLDSNTVLDEKLQKIVDYDLHDDNLEEGFTELTNTISRLHEYIALLNLLHKKTTPTLNPTYAAMLKDATQSLPQDGLNALIQTSFQQQQPVDTIQLIIKKICLDHCLSQLQNYIANLEAIKGRLLLEFSLFGQTIALDDFATTRLILEVLNQKRVRLKALIDQRALPNVAALSVLHNGNGSDAAQCANNLSKDA